MKNELMPAFPLPKGADGTIIGFNNPQNNEDFIKAYQPGFGLTKLEFFSGMAMQGILTTTPRVINVEEGIALAAVRCAKALIAELEKHQ